MELSSLLSLSRAFNLQRDLLVLVPCPECTVRMLRTYLYCTPAAALSAQPRLLGKQRV